MKRLYSTPSLLFLATLSVAIWATNLSDFYPQQSNKYSEFDAPATPTPRKPAEEILEVRSQEQTAEDPLKTWREQSNKNSEFDAPATPTPRKSAEEILEIRPQGQMAEDPLKTWREEQRRQAQPRKYGDFVVSAPPTATAICADGTYSFSRRRRGACSRHGGVAQWLSR